MPTVKNDLASFRSVHDPKVVIPAALNAALDSLRKVEGKEAWRYEMDLFRLAKLTIGTQQLPWIREQFKDHIVVGVTNKRKYVAYFVDPKVAEQARIPEELQL
jgi:hypothetical protein